jgi:uncharacterized membrane protein
MRLIRLRLYRLSGFRLSSIWVLPVLSMALAVVLTPILRAIDQATGWKVLGFGPNGSRALLAMLAASMLSFLVFLFSALLIAVQIASAQLTPRVIATTFLQDRPVKATIGLIVLTFTLSIGVLGRSEQAVLQLSTVVCILLSLVTIAMFLYMIDYSLKALRPVSVIGRVATSGRKVIHDVYPDALDAKRDVRRSVLTTRPPAPDRTLYHAETSAVLRAADFRWLSDTAQAVQGLIELVPRVGTFIAVDEPLFHLYGGAVDLDPGSLRSALAFGQERTLEQDPMFAFRILVDIAAKALSPAINDPTTAVLAIDQIHRLLRVVGKRHLDAHAMLDESGRFGVAFRTPDWEDYVTLSVSEIRQYGATSVQVVRRLRAMLENLRTSLPPDRWPPLELQLQVLDRAVARAFLDPEDQAIAGVADFEGVGQVD